MEKGEGGRTVQGRVFREEGPRAPASLSRPQGDSPSNKW